MDIFDTKTHERQNKIKMRIFGNSVGRGFRGRERRDVFSRFGLPLTGFLLVAGLCHWHGMQSVYCIWRNNSPWMFIFSNAKFRGATVSEGHFFLYSSPEKQGFRGVTISWGGGVGSLVGRGLLFRQIRCPRKQFPDSTLIPPFIFPPTKKSSAYFSSNEKNLQLIFSPTKKSSAYFSLFPNSDYKNAVVAGSVKSFYSVFFFAFCFFSLSPRVDPYFFLFLFRPLTGRVQCAWWDVSNWRYDWLIF